MNFSVTLRLRGESSVFFALIPAAGHSTRMGKPKLALPLGGRCVLEHVIDAFAKAGVPELVVVLGPHVTELGPVAERAGAQAVVLPGFTPDMRTTVEHGLRWIEERHQPAAADAWLLAPADHPVLDAAVVRQLTDVFQAQTRCSIAVPTFNGKRGHPAVISWRHVAGMRALSPNVGLNAYLRQHSDETLEVPVESDSVLLDLDTPAEYERLQQRFSTHPHADG